MTLPFGLGVLRVATPAALAALLAVPLFLLTAPRARRAGACRMIAAACVVLALAGAFVERTTPATGVCVVAAIDVSASVQHGAVDAASDFLARLLPRLGDDDAVGSVAFAGRARVVAHPAGGRAPLSTLLPAADVAPLDPGETDLASALARAAPLCPGDRQAAVVLFTDGNETEGSVLAEAALGESRVPVFPVVPPPTRLPAAGVRRLIAPALAPARAVLPVQAVVENRAAGPVSAALRLAAGDASPMPVPVELPPGVSVVRLPWAFDEPGAQLLVAELLLAPGEPPAPGPVARAMAVTPPVRALVVSERERPVAALALVQHGMDVEVTAPPGLVERADRLDDYHLVVLDDVGRAALPDRALEPLARRVAAGGALVATGGGHLFGDAGLVGTALARLLPVELRSQEPEPKERDPIALYVLIDRSNSMGYASGPGLQYGEKMEYAKRAALAVIDQLGPRDLVGAIAFDSEPYELGPLVPLAAGRSALVAKIRQLRYGGGTDFKDALETARASLLAAGRRVRHVILLTDGDTNRRAEDHDDVIAQLARDEITVTTIRIGDDTVNLELLGKISRATGGFFHHVEDVQSLPQLMISDTQHLMNAAANRREARARIGDPGAILAGIAEDELPPVAGWAITAAKPGAELRLWVDAVERHDPLLATWQYELGRVAAVPMDFQAGAAAWPTWRGFAKLWSQLALWAAPPALARDRLLEARPVPAGTLVRLRTTADEPGPFALRVGDDEVLLRPTGARTFGALLPAMEPGVHDATLVVGGRAERAELVVAPRTPSERELRAGVPDVALLERLAAATGGRVGPEPGDVLTARPGVARRRVPLESALIPLALVLLLADVALRIAGRRPIGEVGARR